MDRARSTKSVADTDVSSPIPPVASTQTTRSTPAAVVRMALRVTELKPGDSARTMMVMTAHASADPSALSAPAVGPSMEFTDRLYGGEISPREEWMRYEDYEHLQFELRPNGV